MSDLNIWTFTGRVGRDPTWKEGGNYQLSTFSVAHEIGWGEKKKTQWVKVKAWNKLGDRVNRFIKKGYKVAVSGEVQIETWTDNQGKVRSDLVVEARTVETMSQGRGGGSGAQENDPFAEPAQGSPAAPAPSPENDPDIPF